MQHDAPCIDDVTVNRIADDAGVDPRSVVRRLAGLPVRGRAGQRIDRALAGLTSASASEPTRAA